MFWRLFSTFLALVAVTVTVVCVLLLYRAVATFGELVADVAPALAAIVALSLIPAYALARRFTQPLVGLARGADRLAHGDFAHRIAPSGGTEFRMLAHSFNAMGARLAATFSELEQDKEQLRTILSGLAEGGWSRSTASSASCSSTTAPRPSSTSRPARPSAASSGR